MKSGNSVSRLIANGITAIGGGLGGFGVYGAVLYHLSLSTATAAFVCGLVMVAVGLYWLTRAGTETHQVNTDERQI